MQRGALIAVLSLVLVGALAIVTPSKAFAAESLTCEDICNALVPEASNPSGYAQCETICDQVINLPPQNCNAICAQAGPYAPGSPDHGTCASICVEVTNNGKTDTVALCKILNAVGMLNGDSIGQCVSQASRP